MNNDLTTISNQVAVIENNTASLLDMRMNPTQFPRIGTYKREDAVFLMSRVVTMAFLLKGKEADPNNIQFISCSLVDELQSDLDKLGTSKISFAEIQRVVKRSVLRDEMFGISVASLFKIIMDYVKGEGHQISLEAQEKARKAREKRLEDSALEPMTSIHASKLIRK